MTAITTPYQRPSAGKHDLKSAPRRKPQRPAGIRLGEREDGMLDRKWTDTGLLAADTTHGRSEARRLLGADDGRGRGNARKAFLTTVYIPAFAYLLAISTMNAFPTTCCPSFHLSCRQSLKPLTLVLSCPDSAP